MANSVFLITPDGEERIGSVEDVQALPGHERDGGDVDTYVRDTSRIIDEVVALAVEQLLYDDEQIDPYTITVEIR